MNYGLLVFYLVSALSLGISIAKHGQDKEVKYSIWNDLITLAISLVMIWWITGWVFI